MRSSTKTTDVIELERRHTSGVYPKREVAISYGQGARLWDVDGNEYLDLASGHGVANLGHAHARVAAAVCEQASRLVTCPETLPNPERARLGSRLAQVTPAGLDRFFLCNSGTEAVEAALKLSRLATGRAEIVSTMRGFHGRTLGSLSATWDKKFREPFAPLVPGVRHVPYGKLDAMSEAIGPKTACAIVEVIQGEGGVHPAKSEYLTGLAALCAERGALLVIDEVQTGFARTGRMFASEHTALAPDLLCLGKAMAGGLPMGAVAIGPRIGELPVGAHGSTFGGNPLACAVATTVLDVIADEGLVERARVLGSWLVDRLRSLDDAGARSIVREVRGLGLMVGIDLRTRVTPILRALMERGVIALPAGPTVLRLLPPLVITQDELERGVETIVEVLAAAAPKQGKAD